MYVYNASSDRSYTYIHQNNTRLSNLPLQHLPHVEAAFMDMSIAAKDGVV